MALFALLFAESQGCERRRDGRKQTGDSTLFDFRPRDLAGGKLKAVGKDRICAWPAFNAVWSAPSRS